MGSFYPGIMNGGGGGEGGSSPNYDKIINAPIKNIGTETSITNLSLLDIGHYNLKGAYKTSEGEEITHLNESCLDVLVLKDTIKEQKTVYFVTLEDGRMYRNMYTYDSLGNLIDSGKIPIDSAYSSWEDFWNIYLVYKTILIKNNFN